MTRDAYIAESECGGSIGERSEKKGASIASGLERSGASGRERT